jgi:teichuronic acid biosynthesis glycosyltransferase TuaC
VTDTVGRGAVGRVRHILLITNSLITDEHPSRGGTWLPTQVRAYRERGIRVGVVCTMQRTGERLRRPLLAGRWVRSTRIDGETPVVLDYGASLLRQRSNWRQRSAPWLPALGARLILRYRLRYGRPDLVHAHCAQYAALAAQGAKRLLGLPYVVTEHQSHYAHDSVAPEVSDAIRRALDAAAAVLAVSPRLRDDLAAWWGRPAEMVGVMPNMVDEDAFPLLPPPPPRPFRFLVVGRLEPIKNHALFVAAFARAFAGTPEVEATIVGGGPLEAELRGTARESGVGERIQFVGARPPAAVAGFLRSSHALVQSSDYETFGLPLTEALASGRPVAATACGGPESIVTPEVGLLVPPRDVEALAAALRTIRARHAGFDPAALRRSVLARFSKGTILDRLTALYESLPLN